MNQIKKWKDATSPKLLQTLLPPKDESCDHHFLPLHLLPNVCS